MNSLKGKTVLITAGPTYEPIDPVRFIGNKSTGKMGYALADAFAQKGAMVILVSGPSHCQLTQKTVKLIQVETAHQMYLACHQEFQEVDIAILSAAVADYTIENPSSLKIKKSPDQKNELILRLTRTKDILKSLGSQKKSNQILVGFALETHNETENALKKLKSKNLDFIVLNSLQDKGAGFGQKTNKITILDKYNKRSKFELKTKEEVAKDILYYIENFK